MAGLAEMGNGFEAAAHILLMETTIPEATRGFGSNFITTHFLVYHPVLTTQF